MNQTVNVHFVGIDCQSAFPVGQATTSKMTLLGRALIETGATVTLLLTKATESRLAPLNNATVGTHRGIQFEYTCGTPIRSSSFWVRRCQAVVSQCVLLTRLFQYWRRRHIVRTVLYLLNDRPTWSLPAILLAKALKFPVIADVCEWRPALSSSTLLQRLYIEHLLFRLVDGAIVISSHLHDRVATYVHHDKPRILDVPIIVDPNEWARPPSGGPHAPYALWCGQIDAYLGYVLWMVRAFAKATTGLPDVNLVIVGHAGYVERTAIESESVACGLSASRVVITGYLSREQLADAYANASVLLVPLEDDGRSKARFPHKLGEYLCSGNVVLTSRVGEVARYLEDHKSALLAVPGDADDFTARLRWILLHPVESAAIGRAGREVATREFAYNQYGPPVRLLVAQLLQGKVA